MGADLSFQFGRLVRRIGKFVDRRFDVQHELHIHGFDDY
jgi:hypothetical protein